MLSIEEIVAKLQDRRLAVIAERTGISERTLYRYRNGELKDPPHATIKALNDYFEEEP